MHSAFLGKQPKEDDDFDIKAEKDKTGTAT